MTWLRIGGAIALAVVIVYAIANYPPRSRSRDCDEYTWHRGERICAKHAPVTRKPSPTARAAASCSITPPAWMRGSWRGTAVDGFRNIGITVSARDVVEQNTTEYGGSWSRTCRGYSASMREFQPNVGQYTIEVRNRSGGRQQMWTFFMRGGNLIATHSPTGGNVRSYSLEKQP